jgi:hypothetical protein
MGPSFEQLITHGLCRRALLRASARVYVREHVECRLASIVEGSKVSSTARSRDEVEKKPKEGLEKEAEWAWRVGRSVRRSGVQGFPLALPLPVGFRSGPSRL